MDPILKGACKFCTKVFSLRSLGFHITACKDNPNRSLVFCTICGKTFGLKSSLRRHHRSVHPPCFNCCSKDRLIESLRKDLSTLQAKVASFEAKETEVATLMGTLGKPLPSALQVSNNLEGLLVSKKHSIHNIQGCLGEPVESLGRFINFLFRQPFRRADRSNIKYWIHMSLYCR